MKASLLATALPVVTILALADHDAGAQILGAQVVHSSVGFHPMTLADSQNVSNDDYVVNGSTTQGARIYADLGYVWFDGVDDLTATVYGVTQGGSAATSCVLWATYLDGSGAGGVGYTATATSNEQAAGPSYGEYFLMQVLLPANQLENPGQYTVYLECYLDVLQTGSYGEEIWGYAM